MVAAVLAPFLIEGGLRLGRAALLSRESAEEKRLRRIAREGAISPRQRQLIQQRLGKELGAQVGQRRADIRGRLAAQGLERSVVGVRALDEPARQAQEAIADTNRDIELLNEQSRADASQRRLALRSQRLAQRNEQLLGAVGTAASALSARRQALLQEEQTTFQRGIQERSVAAQEATAEAVAGLRDAERRRVEEQIANDATIRRRFGGMDPGDILDLGQAIITDPNSTQAQRRFWTLYLGELLRGIE